MDRSGGCEVWLRGRGGWGPIVSTLRVLGIESFEARANEACVVVTNTLLWLICYGSKTLRSQRSDYSMGTEAAA